MDTLLIVVSVRYVKNWEFSCGTASLTYFQNLIWDKNLKSQKIIHLNILPINIRLTLKCAGVGQDINF